MLTIPRVLESDEGLYYCIVTNEWNRSVESDNINFTVYGMLTCKYTAAYSAKNWQDKAVYCVFGIWKI